MLTADKKILIVGLGLIGGSYAEALTRRGFDVTALTRSAESIGFALEKGIISRGFTEPCEDALSDRDIVIFCLYPRVLTAWIEKNQKYIRDGAVLTDVTGVKGAVVYKVQQMLRPSLEFVGAHPMAGREVSGVRNADCSIFRGANYIVTPTAENTPRAVELVEDLGRLLGFSRISVLSPEKHDEMIAFLSQLTHCLAVSLMTCRDVEHLSAYTGDSFRDLTRIARINDEMWSELFLLNREELLRQMDVFSSQMGILREAVASGDAETLKRLMRLSTERRALFDK